MMLPAPARSALPSCSNSRVPSSTTITSECWIRCAELGAVPAGCMVSCTPTDSPVGSVPLKTLRPTEPLGAVFAVISSKEKTRAVARGFVPADLAAALVTAHARSHAVRISLLIEDLSLKAQNVARVRSDRPLDHKSLHPHCQAATTRAG